MISEVTLRYIHFISVFGIVGTLVAEHLLLKPSLTRAEVGRLSKIDAVYGLAAISLLTVGLILWLSGVGKQAEFYSKNWIFHLKLSCFIAIGLLSIYPTIFFIKQRKGNQSEEVKVPSAIFWMLRLELLLLFVNK